MVLINSGKPFRTSDARDFGFSDWGLREAIGAGVLRRVPRGVVVDSLAHDTRELRVASLALVIPDGATVGLHWAAWAYGADTFPPGRRTDLRPTVVVRHGGTRLKGDRFLVRQTKLPDGEPVESDGVLLTSPARTASDLLRLAWRPHAMAAGDAILRAKVVSHEAVMDEVRRYSRVPGAKQAMELAPRLDARANKHGESWTRCRILDAGLPVPALDHQVLLDRRKYYLDMMYLAQLVACEYDGREHHEGELNIVHDDDRRGLLKRRLGIQWVIATYERVFQPEDPFEVELGNLLGLPVRPRTW